MMARVKAFAMQVLATITSCPIMTQAAKDATTEYVQNLRKIEKDFTYQPQQGGVHLSGVDVGYLTEVSAGLAVSWVCRYADCLWFGMNSQWVKGRTEKFRCPECAREHAPWSTAGGQIANASRVVSFKDSAGKAWAFLASWPPSTEDRWLARMCEARFLALQQTMVPQAQHIDAFANKAVADIDAFCKERGIPGHFVHTPTLSQGVLDLLNTTSSDRWPRQNWQHLIEHGFWGNKLEPEQAEHIFGTAEWENMINLVAHLMLAANWLSARDVL